MTTNAPAMATAYIDGNYLYNSTNYPKMTQRQQMTGNSEQDDVPYGDIEHFICNQKVQDGQDFKTIHHRSKYGSDEHLYNDKCLRDSNCV